MTFWLSFPKPASGTWPKQTHHPVPPGRDTEPQLEPQRAAHSPPCCLQRELHPPSLTLLWITTTLWLSALSHVSMALQMLQILSRAGAWWSGQPKSNTWEGGRGRLDEEQSGCGRDEWRAETHLRIELTDVITFLTEIEELKINKENINRGVLTH